MPAQRTSITAATTDTGVWTGGLDWGNEFISIQASAAREALEALGSRSIGESGDTGKIHAQLYFSYVKSKFSLLERIRMDRRVKVLEKAFEAASNNGQDMLAEKMLRELVAYSRCSVMAAKGIKWVIAKEDLNKHKRHIKGGHISDTPLAKYTRIIPKKAVKRMEELNGVFDDYVIYHYWNEKADDVKSMSPDEKRAMRDPVLFGLIKEAPEKLFFVADWEDEYCDLTFDEMLEAMGKEYSEVKVPDKPQF